MCFGDEYLYFGGPPISVKAVEARFEDSNVHCCTMMMVPEIDDVTVLGNRSCLLPKEVPVEM